MDRRSIALDQLEEQPSDAADRFFSFDPAAWVSGEQMSCHITRTTAETHQLIRDNLHLTAIYGGVIDSKGPRLLPLHRRQDRSLCRQGQPPDLPRAGRA